MCVYDNDIIQCNLKDIFNIKDYTHRITTYNIKYPTQTTKKCTTQYTKYIRFYWLQARWAHRPGLRCKRSTCPPCHGSRNQCGAFWYYGLFLATQGRHEQPIESSLRSEILWHVHVCQSARSPVNLWLLLQGNNWSRYLRQNPNLAKKIGESYFKSGDALAAAVTSMAYIFFRCDFWWTRSCTSWFGSAMICRYYRYDMLKIIYNIFPLHHLMPVETWKVFSLTRWRNLVLYTGTIDAGMHLTTT